MKFLKTALTTALHGIFIAATLTHASTVTDADSAIAKAKTEEASLRGTKADPTKVTRNVKAGKASSWSGNGCDMMPLFILSDYLEGPGNIMEGPGNVLEGPGIVRSLGFVVPVVNENEDYAGVLQIDPIGIYQYFSPDESKSYSTAQLTYINDSTDYYEKGFGFSQITASGQMGGGSGAFNMAVTGATGIYENTKYKFTKLFFSEDGGLVLVFMSNKNNCMKWILSDKNPGVHPWGFWAPSMFLNFNDDDFYTDDMYGPFLFDFQPEFGPMRGIPSKVDFALN